MLACRGGGTSLGVHEPFDQAVACRRWTIRWVRAVIKNPDLFFFSIKQRPQAQLPGTTNRQLPTAASRQPPPTATRQALPEPNLHGDALCFMVIGLSLLQKLAVGGWRLAVGGWWRLAAAGCGCWSTVRVWWGLPVGGWRLVAVRGGRTFLGSWVFQNPGWAPPKRLTPTGREGAVFGHPGAGPPTHPPTHPPNHAKAQRWQNVSSCAFGADLPILCDIQPPPPILLSTSLVRCPDILVPLVLTGSLSQIKVYG